jgi:hypothetical protein
MQAPGKLYTVIVTDNYLPLKVVEDQLFQAVASRR